MFIEFENRTTKMLCNSRDLLRGSFGELAATNLQRLLWMLDVAPNLGVLTNAPPISLSKFPDEVSCKFSVGGRIKDWPRLVFRLAKEIESLEKVESIIVLEVCEASL